MKFKELKDLQPDELKKKLNDFQTELIKLRGAVASGSAPKNTSQIRNTKKSIARVLTELKQRGVQRNG